VQRILKEHGIASVQRLSDGSAVASFGAIEEAVGHSVLEPEEGGHLGAEVDADDDDFEGTDGIDFRLLDEDEDDIPGVLDASALPGLGAGARLLDAARLEGVLQELMACRQLLDQALKGG
jgi:hypothetical protein